MPTRTLTPRFQFSVELLCFSSLGFRRLSPIHVFPIQKALLKARVIITPIMNIFGSFLPSLGRSINHSLLGPREPTLLLKYVPPGTHFTISASNQDGAQAGPTHSCLQAFECQLQKFQKLTTVEICTRSFGLCGSTIVDQKRPSACRELLANDATFKQRAWRSAWQVCRRVSCAPPAACAPSSLFWLRFPAGVAASVLDLEPRQPADRRNHTAAACLLLTIAAPLNW